MRIKIVTIIIIRNLDNKVRQITILLSNSMKIKAKVAEIAIKLSLCGLTKVLSVGTTTKSTSK